MSPPATILIVDDNDANRETLRELLDSQGHRFIEAADGMSALRLAKETPPDLVLLDVMMPGMSGYEVCRQLRSDARLAEVPVIMVTALDDQESRLAGIEAGADDFITKPFNATEMRARVRSITRLNRYRRLHETQAALRQSEKRFRLLFELGPVAIYTCDISGTIQEFNQRAVELWGRTPTAGNPTEQYCGSYRLYHSNGTFMHHDHSPMAEVVTGKTVAVFNSEYLIERPDGTLISVIATIDPLRNEQGEITGAINCFQDVTERKRAEAELRACDERFRMMVEGVTDYAIFMLDTTGHVVSWNAGAERIHGYQADEIIGKHFSRFYPKEGVERGKPEQELQKATSDGRYKEEGWRVRKDGSLFMANVVITALFDHAGGLSGFANVTRDISERKQLDKILFENEERLRLALDSAQMGTFEWDILSNRITWSHRHEELWGYAPGESGGTYEAFFERIHPEDKPGTHSVITRCIAQRERFWHEFRVVWPDNSIHWITGRGNCEYSAEGQPLRMRGTAIDITERKQTEAVLSKVEERLRQSQKMDALGQLAGGVAHDFNNQLSVILGYANMLESQVELPKPKKYIENICKAVQRSSDLTRNLLAFARKGQNQSLLVHVHSLIDETIEMLERTIDKRIEIKKTFDACTDVVLGDPSQLQHAFLNLSVNARDAMATGGSLIFETEILNIEDEFIASHGGGIQAGRYIKISVSDTGSGMSDEVKKHLFEPFFTTKPLGKGTGLGLASVYGTIKNHKGTLDVHSEIGRGTTFKLYLPLAEQTQSAKLMAQKDISSGKLNAVKNLCVLLVEDEEILRTLFSDMLGVLGIKCLEAKNGRHGVEMYEQLWKQIDVVILDMIMPEMDGPDAFRAMKKINPDIRAMLSTGFSLNNEIQAVLDEGVLGFLHKPFMKNELIEKIIEVMR